MPGQEPEQEPENDNPEITTYRKNGDNLIIDKTHGKPLTKSKVHNMGHVQAQIDKLDGIISIWEARRQVYVGLQEEFAKL